MDVTEFRSSPKRIVLADLNQNGGSPVSPMANLRLLTKVATSHFPVGENKECPEGSSENQIKTDQKLSRRLRSLSFICKKFLLLYKLDVPPGQIQQISLGNLAISLGIEKRRVYDIINVVASLQMAVKVCKDRYKWFGNQNLPSVLSKLKAYALLNKFDEQINAVLENQSSSLTNVQDIDSSYLSNLKITTGMNHAVFEEKRIGILCQKFIMLFLASKKDVHLNLGTISKLILTGDTQDKTGMRRLYDIANVLKSLNLIKKCHCKIMKKTLFTYCGPDVEITSAVCEDVISRGLLQVGQNSESNDQDTNSQSSLDFVQGLSKLDSILEVVCTELEGEMSSSNLFKKRPYSPTERHPVAKKQLFSTSMVVDKASIRSGTDKGPEVSYYTLESAKHLSKEKTSAVPSPTGQGSQNFKLINQSSNFSGNFQILPPGEITNKSVCSSFKILSNPQTNYTSLTSQNFVKLCNEPAQNKEMIIRKVITNSSFSSPNSSAPLCKIVQPLKLSDIKDGGVYKVLKRGNTVQFFDL